MHNISLRKRKPKNKKHRFTYLERKAKDLIKDEIPLFSRKLPNQEF